MSLESVGDHFNAAQAHLEAARFCEEQGRSGLATSESYFSTVASANGMFLVLGHSSRKSHSGVLNAVYHLLIQETGLLSAEDHSRMTDAKNWRRRWDYEGREAPGVLAEKFVVLAERFLVVSREEW